MPEIKDNQAEKERAAYTLSDEVLKLRINLERAETVLQEIQDGYFDKYNTETEQGRFSIAWEYGRYGIFADIVSDYLFIMRETLQDLADKKRAGAARKGEKKDNGEAQS